jgi:1-acyl-sn-glycerol-3-phosphate acyltransferase
MPYRVTYKRRLDPDMTYIFCSNHFSYLDIPSMGLNKMNAIFVGKSDMVNIPWFGWMYKKLHMTVDRTRLMSKFNSFKRSIEAIEQGKSLIYFPEGGIITAKDPVMSPFKDGAFRVAIEKHVPIVPVTIPNNWIILPPDEFLFRWGKVELLFHEPIYTTSLTMKDLDQLKSQVYKTIESELKTRIGNADN